MVIVGVVLVLIVCGALVFMLWASTAPPEPPVSDEELLQTRLELHRIGRRLDVTLAKHEQRREAERARRDIADALEDQP